MIGDTSCLNKTKGAYNTHHLPNPPTGTSKGVQQPHDHANTGSNSKAEPDCSKVNSPVNNTQKHTWHGTSHPLRHTSP